MSLTAVLCLGMSLAAYKVKGLDVPLHLAAGKYIVTNHEVPKTDIFSFSREGEEYIDAQWLFQVVCYGAYRAAGEGGLSLVVVILILSILLLLMFAVPAEIPISLRALAGAAFLLGFNLRILCRPELLSCLWMALMFFALERARNGKSAWLFVAPLAQLFFANTEGIWPIGLGIMFAYAADLWFDRWRAPGFSWRRPLPAAWIMAGAASVLACFLQPYGLRGMWFPLVLLWEITNPDSMHSLLVSEVDPVSMKNIVHPTIIGFVAFEALAWTVTLFAGRRMRPGLVFLGLLFTYLGFSSVRNISLACAVHLPMLLVHLERNFKLCTSRPLEWAAAAGVIIVSVVFSGLSMRGPHRTWDHTMREPGFGLSLRLYPRGAAEFLEMIGYQGNIMNDDSVAGWLLWMGWPRWKVFADTRLEIGGEDALRLFNIVFSDIEAFRQTAEKHDAETAVLNLYVPHIREMAHSLAYDKDWALVYYDPNAAVFLRRLPKWEQVIAKYEIKPQ